MQRHIKSIFFLGLIMSVCASVFGQSEEPQNGVKNSYKPIYAFKNAKIYVSPTRVLENATLIVQDGKVIEINKLNLHPKNAIVKDCKNQIIIPSFIDLYTTYGINPIKRSPWNPKPQLESKKEGAYYWNESIKPEVNASEQIKIDAKSRKSFIQNGFGVVNSHQQDGIVRGTAVLVNLSRDDNEMVITENSAMHFSFKKGASHQSYPSSQMGAIALLRQFFEDANHYKSTKKTSNLSLNAYNRNTHLPFIFEVDDKLEFLRADRLGDSANIQFIIKGSGNEYQRLDDIKTSGAPVILPLNFPKGIALNDPYVINHIPLGELKHWELAPSNPYFLYKMNIPFAITSSHLEKPSDFLNNLKLAIKRGLPIEKAINALSTYPAQLMHIDDQYGTLDEGKMANFLICEDHFFTSPKSKILENWVLGEKNEVNQKQEDLISGNYNLTLKDKSYPLNITYQHGSYVGKLTYIKTNVDSINQISSEDTIQSKVNIQTLNETISLSVIIENKDEHGALFLGGTFDTKFGIMDGDGLDSYGKPLIWSAIKKAGSKKPESNKEPNFKLDTLSLESIWYPNMAFGFDTIPPSTSYLIRNATLWTNEAAGIIQNADILIKEGKIIQVGTINGTIPKNTITIDAKGKHVTSGIIDEHSHIAISKGVNESGQSISAEVSIGDVVNSYDIDIYRQLAGGVTTSQLLHGSANAIGGQSAIIKLKWGSSPEEMKIDNATKFIKFALGENVKQTNWGDYSTVRFPQTRMGVEQVFYDAFERAKKYKATHDSYNKLSEKAKRKKQKPAIDYELEVLLEILESKRFVTCHSYIQSEINMLMKVADSMGFTLNTFTHILEGYKVADKMKAHGAGGSTFSDWWAYKFEVNDAIPYNASMLNAMGIVTAINSDDAEMARRLNQEAGKAVKYGNTSPEDAWKMVTLNPAKLLHLDHRIGSLKKGKDADIVIWSDNPLSVNAKVEKTFVEGSLLYDASKQEELDERNRLEKARILTKMKNSKLGTSAQKKPFTKKKKSHYHCDTIGH